MRSVVTFAMMECGGGDDTCFCVSMGSNKTDDYALAFRFREDGPMCGSKMIPLKHILTACRRADTYLLL